MRILAGRSPSIWGSAGSISGAQLRLVQRVATRARTSIGSTTISSSATTSRTVAVPLDSHPHSDAPGLCPPGTRCWRSPRPASRSVRGSGAGPQGPNVEKKRIREHPRCPEELHQLRDHLVMRVTGTPATNARFCHAPRATRTAALTKNVGQGEAVSGVARQPLAGQRDSRLSERRRHHRRGMRLHRSCRRLRSPREVAPGSLVGGAWAAVFGGGPSLHELVGGAAFRNRPAPRPRRPPLRAPASSCSCAALVSPDEGVSVAREAVNGDRSAASTW
jgi:hypothetical protein